MWKCKLANDPQHRADENGFDKGCVYCQLQDEYFHVVEGLRVKLCELLEIDYCIAKDEDIYNAIRRLKGTATDEQQELYCSM